MHGQLSPSVLFDFEERKEIDRAAGYLVLNVRMGGGMGDGWVK